MIWLAGSTPIDYQHPSFVTPDTGPLYDVDVQVMELEQRGKSAGSVAAERAEQVKELGVRAETAELLAAERESQIKELEERALSAEADAREQAKQVGLEGCLDRYHVLAKPFTLFGRLSRCLTRLVSLVYLLLFP